MQLADNKWNEVNYMAAVIRFIGTLGGKALSWAKSHKETIYNWYKNGLSFNWISDKIDQIIAKF